MESLPFLDLELDSEEQIATLQELAQDRSSMEHSLENISLQNLALHTDPVQMEADAQQMEDTFVEPPLPETLQDTGLAASVVEQLILKLLYFRGDLLGRDLSEALGLKFSLVDSFIEQFKRQHFIQAKKSMGMGNSTSVFALTEAGRTAAREAMENNQYSGPAPVPLDQYCEIVRRQRRADGWLTPETLKHAYRGMVMTERVLAQIGPAVSSGNSFLIYGQPGNGKTFLAEALGKLDDSTIFVPYAIECQGAIIQVYDPVYHQRVEDVVERTVLACGHKYDARWVRCKRPFILTGGELTLTMLDLKYNETSKIYDAPYQLKANNGIYLIDDFGRQLCSPAEVLNRWIVPMERRVDYLKFLSGGKMTVPFEAFLIFSTNLRPDQLGDEAFLRRIQYKMLVRNPDKQEFAEIFRKFCSQKNLPHQESSIHRFIERNYQNTGKMFRRCHPRDVLSHAIDMIHFEKHPFHLTDDLLDRAFESCFLEETGE